MISYILSLAVAVLVVIGDQISKYFITANLELYETAKFLPGLIDIVYIHNRGAAWGMLEGRTWLLVVFTAAIMIFGIFVLIKAFGKNKLFFWALSLALSGGIGNLIDRIFRGGNVVDFMQFAFWKTFPVFNVADCAIVVGMGLIILYLVLDTVKEYKLKKNG